MNQSFFVPLRPKSLSKPQKKYNLESQHRYKLVLIYENN